MFYAIFITIFLLQNSVDATKGIIGPQKKPLKYVYEQGCYIEIEDKVIAFNTTYYPKAMASCLTYFCGFDEYTYITECIQGLDGDCTLVNGNKSLHYPYCCDYCIPSNKRPTSNITTGKNSSDVPSTIESNRVQKPELLNLETQIPNRVTGTEVISTLENIKDKLKNNKTISKLPEKNAKRDAVKSDSPNATTQFHKDDTVATNTSTTETNKNEKSKNNDDIQNLPNKTTKPGGDISPETVTSLSPISIKDTSTEITGMTKNDNQNPGIDNTAKGLKNDKNIQNLNGTQNLDNTDRNLKNQTGSPRDAESSNSTNGNNTTAISNNTLSNKEETISASDTVTQIAKNLTDTATQTSKNDSKSDGNVETPSKKEKKED